MQQNGPMPKENGKVPSQNGSIVPLPLTEKMEMEDSPGTSADAQTATNKSNPMAAIAQTYRKIRGRSRNRVNAAPNTEQSDFMTKHGMTVSQTDSNANEAKKVVVHKTMKERIHDLVVNPSGELYYAWISVVTLAVLYNMMVVPARAVFHCNDRGVENKNVCITGCEAKVFEDEDPSAGEWFLFWTVFDIIADLIYVLDTLLHFRKGYLEQGLIVTDAKSLAKNYARTFDFKLAIGSLLPIEYVAQMFGYDYPALRLNRLLRVQRASQFITQTETRSRFPNMFRVLCVVLYIVVIIHWNGCVYFFISDEIVNLHNDSWVYGGRNYQVNPPGGVCQTHNVGFGNISYPATDSLLRRYVYSFYWSTLTLTTIGEVPPPVTNLEFIFVTVDFLIGVLIFATIVGNVGSMIQNMSAARTEFQNKMDAVKHYMEFRRVGKELQHRVIKWFDYLWTNNQSLADEDVLVALPVKLQAEINMHVHFETLRKVRIFQDCEAGLLVELVLQLQLQVFSPGDYICRKGDIGREMYIVKRGKLEVVASDGIQVFVTLGEGAVFGELSILNIAGSKNGNRRTANVRSVGYTDLFVLNKDALWNALREYPDARRALIAKGREILKKDNLLDENAPEEQVTTDEKAELLDNSVDTLQTRFARLLAESTSAQKKMHERIRYLEDTLSKYKLMAAQAQARLSEYSDQMAQNAPELVLTAQTPSEDAS